MSTELTTECDRAQCRDMINHTDNPSPGLDPIEAFYRAVRLTRPLLRHITASVDSGARVHGVTVGQRAVMEALSEGGAMTGPELVKALALKRQFVSRMLAETDRAGFTGRTPNPRRAKAYLHALNEKGHRALAAIRADERAALETFAASVAPRDIAAWCSVQAQLTRFFAGRAGSQASPGKQDHEGN